MAIVKIIKQTDPNIWYRVGQTFNVDLGVPSDYVKVAGRGWLYKEDFEVVQDDAYSSDKCNIDESKLALNELLAHSTLYPRKSIQEVEDIINKKFPNWKSKNSTKDPISPEYYKGKVECIEAIQEATKDLQGIEAVDTGQIIKYIWRWKKKNGLQDLLKANYYLQHLIKQCETH